MRASMMPLVSKRGDLYILEVEEEKHKSDFYGNISTCTFIFISSKVGSVGPVQQEIKLRSCHLEKLWKDLKRFLKEFLHTLSTVMYC